MYPIVQYAKMIGKNTAEFTASDMARFTIWWMGQDMKKYQSEQDFRIARQQEEYEVITMDEFIQKNNKQTQNKLEQKVQQEIAVKKKDTTIVCEMGLTKQEVDSVKWVFKCWLQQYKKHEYSEYRESIEGLMEALEEL